MAIEDILSGLEIQAKAESDQVMAEAQAEADQVTAATEQEAGVAADAYVAAQVDEVKRSSERDVNAAAATCRRQMADVRREVFDEVFIRAGEKIKAARAGRDYPRTLSRLIVEATSDMGDGYVLHVDPQDKELVKSLCPGGVSCVTDIETMGGVVVTSADGRVKRSSTFEDRLKRVQEEHIEKIAKVLGV